MALHGIGPWTSIVGQVLDGPPGEATRRLSTFLLIPVGSSRQGFAYGSPVNCLFAQRADIGGEISRFVPAQRKIRHLWVRVEQEEGHRSEERRVGKECRSRWSPY